MRKIAIAAALAVLILPAFALADTCAVGQSPCTLPCTATTTVTPILGKNGNRRVFIFVNTGQTTIFVIVGAGATAQNYTYGIPVPAFGTAGYILDFEVQPDPNKNLHTWTSSISIVTQTGTSSCVYGEQTN